MENDNEGELFVTAKNCRSLIGKRINIVLSGDVKTDVDSYDKKSDSSKPTNNQDLKEGEPQKELIDNISETNGPSKDQSLVENELVIKNGEPPIDKTIKDDSNNKATPENGIVDEDKKLDQNEEKNSSDETKLPEEIANTLDKADKIETEEIKDTSDLSAATPETVNSSDKAGKADQSKAGKKKVEKIDTKKKLRDKGQKKSEDMVKKTKVSVTAAPVEAPVESAVPDVVVEDPPKDEAIPTPLDENSETAEDKENPVKDISQEDTPGTENSVDITPAPEISVEKTANEVEVAPLEDVATVDKSNENVQDVSPEEIKSDACIEDAKKECQSGEVVESVDSGTLEAAAGEKTDTATVSESQESPVTNEASEEKQEVVPADSKIPPEDTVPPVEDVCPKVQDNKSDENVSGNVDVNANDKNEPTSSEDTKEQNVEGTLPEPQPDSNEPTTDANCQSSQEQEAKTDADTPEVIGDKAPIEIENVEEKTSESTVQDTSNEEAASVNVSILFFIWILGVPFRNSNMLL